jgi:hypothetical protein
MGLLLTFMFLWNMVGALWLLPALAQFLVKPEKFVAMGDQRGSSTGAGATVAAGRDSISNQ